jgi:acyl-CoA reductase-like NAD-dependent aldehyde dehydrogenase
MRSIPVRYLSDDGMREIERAYVGGKLAVPYGAFRSVQPVKQSGIGCEHGVHGLEAFLDPKAILTAIQLRTRGIRCQL